MSTVPANDETLLEHACRTPLAAGPLRALAAEAGEVDWAAQVDAALAAGELHGATMLGLAAAARAQKLPGATLRALLPEVDSVLVFPALLSTSDDVVSLVCGLAAGGRLSWEREALCLYVASQHLRGAAPPRALIARVRRMLRLELSLEAGLCVIEAARALASPDLETLLEDLLYDDPELEAQSGRRERARLRRDVIDEPLSWVPEQPPPKAITGYTYVRTEQEPGRNDPCPCGSGKKYKKCHALVAAQEPRAPVSETGFSSALLRPGALRRVPMAQYEGFRASELARLPPPEMSTHQLVVALRTLARFGRFEAAEAVMSELAKRDDTEPLGGASGFREELVDEAIFADRLDVAERQVALLEPEIAGDPRIQLNLALARRDPAAWVLAEALALQGLGGDVDALYDVVFALLRYSPALGILAARGSFAKERPLDNEEVLRTIQDVRDDLVLDPDEPYADVLDALASRRTSLALEQSAAAARERRGGDQADTLQRLGDEMQAARERGRALEQDLRAREQAFEALKLEHGELKRKVEVAGTEDLVDKVAGLERERADLRSRIRELKDTMREGAEQRRHLREQLAEAESAAESRSRSKSALDAVREQDREEAEEAEWIEDVDHDGRLPLRQQVFSAQAIAQLEKLPREVAARALALCAALAAGEEHAFSGVKRLKRATHTWSVRVDRSHRLLFSTTPSELRIAEVIARRDLEQAIERVRGR